MDHSQLSKSLLDLFDNNLTECLRWMDTPHQVFGGLTPLDKIQEDEHTDAVLTVVMQLCDGAYA